MLDKRTSVLALLFACTHILNTITCVRITFWSDTNMRGEQYNIDMVQGECYKLGISNDRLSSMSSYGHCVDIYTRDDCFGGMFRMEANSSACHRDFGDCDMNDRVSSVRLCPRCRNTCYWFDGQNNNNYNDYDNDACHCNCNCGSRNCPNHNGVNVQPYALE